MAGSILGDIRSGRLIVVKGVLMALTSGLAAIAIAAIVLSDAGPSESRVGLFVWIMLLHAVGVWSACRAYYFAFYVIEKYVDDGFRFAGVGSAIVWIIRSRGAARSVRASNSAAGLASADDRLDQPVGNRTGE